jgi:hypothetical protein
MLARQIAGARLVVGGQDLFLNGFDVAARSDVEHAVPRRNDGKRPAIARRDGLNMGAPSQEVQALGGTYMMIYTVCISLPLRRSMVAASEPTERRITPKP